MRIEYIHAPDAEIEYGRDPEGQEGVSITGFLGNQVFITGQPDELLRFAGRLVAAATANRVDLVDQ